MNTLTKIKPLYLLPLFCPLFIPVSLFADSNNISKIEHPYVQLQEKEISLLSLYQKDKNTSKNYVVTHELSFGKAFSDNKFVELTVSGKNNSSQNFQASSYEAELKWQMTEQGEYSADYGLLFKYEHEHDIDLKEVSIGLLTEKQFGKWVGTTNLSSIYEWGNHLQNEFETTLAIQAKYRYKPTLEPAIEFYAGELNKGIGPILMGTQRLAPGKKLKWELGTIWGIDKDSSNQTYRALFAFEF